ncbi:hypothetical protein G4G28_13225 [Massilia sp. Dwa41.01b]|uniref:hypothetical protein n=1 Tax=unclassified Massilia TaxID=2609279 RepID=UPI00160352AD|nr:MULTISPECIES: hypothetical protein [unclassified Massilia]QNA89185.1 hypothetical protein G4G28_13225 [Massilia sp. Dwa41.01b]QNB00086.1 hypothetical protein G4G31_16775 [Massilia sp. Se16.2.3]
MMHRASRRACTMLAACAAVLWASGAAAAGADYLTLSERYGTHTVLGAAPAIKIGKAVMVRVLRHRPADKEIATEHFLLACDGSWMTDNFAYLAVASTSGIPDFAAAERQSIAQMPAVIQAAHNFSMQDQDPYEVGPLIKKQLPRICAQARPARAGMLVPITETDEFDGQLLVFSILPKPVLVKGDRVRAWFRTTIHTQGSRQGKTPAPAIPTGEYWMTLKEVDCKAPRAAELERIVHGGDKPGRTVCTKCGTPALEPVKEHSIGDAERKMACRLFGPPGAALPL